MFEHDRWEFHRRALRGDFSGWDGQAAPFPGFYRFRRGRLGIWAPCAIWDKADGTQAALAGVPNRGGFREATISPLRLWSTVTGYSCWMHPVTEEQYRHAIEFGDWWDSLRAPDDGGKPGRVVADVREAAPIGPPKRGGVT